MTLHDGTYAIFHIGGGDGLPDGGQNCTKPGSEQHSVNQSVYAEARATAGSTIHVASSLDGPWEPLTPNLLGGCNNPAPWVHKNGTIFIVCGASLKRATSIHGPWETVALINPSGTRVSGHYEDPYLYIDRRGHFHLLYHVYETHPAYECVDATVAAHAFSPDGFSWYTSDVQPYTTQVVLSSGEKITVSTRERPKLFFAADGTPTHLLNGVCSALACPPPAGPSTGCVDCKYKSWDYTLVAPLHV